MFRRRGLRRSESIIVHTTFGASFYGVVKGLHRDVLVLTSARTLPDREPLLGDVDIPWVNYAWSQRAFPVEVVLGASESPAEAETPVLASVG